MIDTATIFVFPKRSVLCQLSKCLL